MNILDCDVLRELLVKDMYESIQEGFRLVSHQKKEKPSRKSSSIGQFRCFETAVSNVNKHY